MATSAATDFSGERVARSLDGDSIALKSGEREIQRRTFQFAVRILKMVRVMPRDVTGPLTARQLARSATSIGANIEEAQGAQSRADFARRMNIALSEARETLYWLRLIAEAGVVSTSRLKAITHEAEELVRILVTIVKKIRMNRKQIDE